MAVHRRTYGAVRWVDSETRAQCAGGKGRVRDVAGGEDITRQWHDPFSEDGISRFFGFFCRVRELENVRSFITGTALTLVLDVLFSVLFVVVMFFYSTKLTFVALAAVPFLVLLSVIVTPVLRARLKRRFQCNAESQSYMVEAVTGIGTVKSLAVEPQLNMKWEGLLANYVGASFKAGIVPGRGICH